MRLARLAILAALGCALTLRLVGTDWGDPYGYHYDEPAIVAPALRIVESGDPNPHFFRYPSALIYVESVVVWLQHRLAGMDLARASGAAYGPADLGPWTWPALLGGRRVVAVLGTAAVGAGAWLAATCGGTAAAVLAAWMLAVLPLHVEHSHYLTTDAPATTLVLLSLALAAARSSPPARVAAAGAAMGLAVATKYTAGFALPAVLLLVAIAEPSRWARRAAIASLAAFVAFVAACPFALLDWSSFVSELGIVRDHYTGGHLGAEGTANWGWYLLRLRQDGLGSTALALLTIGCGAIVYGAVVGYRRARTGATSITDDGDVWSILVAVVVLLTGLAWYAWLGSVSVRFERNLLPALALVVVAAAAGLALICRQMRASSRGRALICYTIIAIALTSPLSLSISSTRRFAGDDTRGVALAWINANIAAGSVIVREEYTPRPDPERYLVEYVWSLGFEPAASYARRGVDYVIASRAVHGRLMRDPTGRYRHIVERYKWLFLSPQVATFLPGPRTMGPVISIHRIVPNGAKQRSE